MKAFRFRLESFLHLRSLTREKCLKEYAQAIEERQRQEELREMLSRKLAQIESSVASKRQEGIRGSDQDAFLGSIEHAKVELINQRVVASQALAEEEKKRTAYIEADIAEKTLLRLKEHRKKEHHRVQEAKEERALEDMIGARHGFISPNEVSYETA